MRTQTKVWLIVAVSLLVVGCIVFGGVMSVLKWDFKELSTTKFENNTYETAEKYTDISIITDTADIVFVPTDNQRVTVMCYEQKNEKHTVLVQDDCLVIHLSDTRKWYEHIGITFGTPAITVYMPGGTYGALNVKTDTGRVEIPKDFTFESINIQGSTGDVTNYASALNGIKVWVSTGDIRMEKVAASTLDIAVSTGKVTATDITCTGDVAVSVSTGKSALANVCCANLLSSGNTGSISLDNVIAKNEFSVVRTTGDVTFKACDAAEISVTTDTGDVKGSLLTEKVFVVKTDTGRVTVPETTGGGKCKITTDTGNIDMTVISESQGD